MLLAPRIDSLPSLYDLRIPRKSNSVRQVVSDMNTSTSNELILSSMSGDETATIVVGGIVVGLAIISVALRFHARAITKAGLSWDDWLILVAVLAAVLSTVLFIWGMGRIQVFIDSHEKS